MNRSSLSVRMKGLEPPLLTEPDPKSGAATNYATCANAVQRYDYFLNFQNFKENTYAYFYMELRNFLYYNNKKINYHV